MPAEIQRIKLLKGTRGSLEESEVILLDGELCLVNSEGTGYDSLVIGDGRTEAKSLTLIPLNVAQGSVFLGRAHPTLIPGTPTGPVFYLADIAGEYTGFGNMVIDEGETAFIMYRYGGWSKITINTKQIIDTELSDTSENPVQNKVIYKALKDLKDEIFEGKVTIDSEFSDSSENPVMNRTITRKFNEFDWYEQ